MNVSPQSCTSHLVFSSFSCIFCRFKALTINHLISADCILSSLTFFILQPPAHVRAVHNTPLKRANCCFLKCLQSPTSYKVSTRSNHYLESSLDVTFSVHFFLLILQNKPVLGKNWVFTVERTFVCKTQGHLLLTWEDLTVRRQETGGGIGRFHSQRS